MMIGSKSDVFCAWKDRIHGFNFEIRRGMHVLPDLVILSKYELVKWHNLLLPCRIFSINESPGD